MREALGGETPLFLVAAPWSGLGAAVFAFVGVLVLLSAVAGVLSVTGLDAFGIVWSLLFGGIGLVVLVPRLLAGVGRKWFAGTSTRLVVVGPRRAASIPWEDLCEEVRVSGAGSRGRLTLRLRGPGPSADALARAGLARMRAGVAGRDPSVRRGGRRERHAHRALEVHMAGVRRHAEVAEACARLLGRPALNPRRVVHAVDGKPLPGKVLLALDRAPVDGVVRGASVWIDRIPNVALALLLGALAALFGFLWWSALTTFLGGGSATGWGYSEARMGTLVFPVFLVPLLFVVAVNLVQLFRPRPWVALAPDGLRVVEGRAVRWLAWSRVDGEPKVTWDGLVRLRLKRADYDPAAAHLPPEDVELAGRPDAAALARRIQDLARRHAPAEASP